MRKLASVQRIAGLQPIDGRDRIELASVLGWHVIVKKDEFSVGDLCVYIEIDSVLPEKPEFEFLRPKNFRIKTMKMGGAISQGIVFPMSLLPAGDYAEGDDVTDIIGVKQFEPTMDVERGNDQPQKQPKRSKFLMRFKWYRDRLPKKKSRAFPDFISKTDEIRIQNVPFMLEDKSEDYIVTEKVDGQSATYALVLHKRRLPFLKPKEEYIVCSRNLRLFEHDDSNYWKVSDKYHMRAALKAMLSSRGGDWIAVQGEIIAPNVQKNKYGVTEPEFYVFNVITPEGRLGSNEAKNGVQCVGGLKFVPILQYCYRLPDTVDEMIAYADGKSELSDTLREGVVVRSSDGQKSFKAVSNAFLLKWNE